MLDKAVDVKKRLIQLREGNPDLTNMYLAKLCDVSDQAVGQWFKNGRIKASNALVIAEVYQCNIKWLITGEGPKYLDDNLTNTPLAEPGQKIADLYQRLSPTRREIIDALMRDWFS